MFKTILTDVFLYSGLIGMVTIDSENRFVKKIYKADITVLAVAVIVGLFVWFK